MTPSTLKAKVQATGSKYFDKKTMRFFGDTMTNYGVRLAERDGVEVYELYRKEPVKDGIKFSAYFDKETFKYL